MNNNNKEILKKNPEPRKKASALWNREKFHRVYSAAESRSVNAYPPIIRC